MATRKIYALLGALSTFASSALAHAQCEQQVHATLHQQGHNKRSIMRNKVIDEHTIALMGELKREGASYRQLADRFAVGLPTVYYAFNGRKPPRQAPANDNYPDRVTRMSARNGGCSTTSGKMPVTLVRIPTIDGPAPLQVAA